MISDKVGTLAISRARTAGIPSYEARFGSLSDFEDYATEVIARNGCDYVCLLGFRSILSKNFVSKWAEKIINTHPSLLPSFKGLNTHQKALDSRVKIHGCSVHEVTEKLDQGPIVVQGVVPVLPGDDVEILRERVDRMALICLPHALRIEAARLGSGGALAPDAMQRLVVHPALGEYFADDHSSAPERGSAAID
ncbi:phosphoribosylglycinamide formyltransferase [Xanthomonas graminis]|uniref:phosphoribosylglycinamide formyltransferase n=1 Tax=Xanthomonas graminis TaxID=3390026 RepID=UPI00396A802D